MRWVRRGGQEGCECLSKVEPGTKSVFASEFLIINDASRRIIINKQRWKFVSEWQNSFAWRSSPSTLGRNGAWPFWDWDKSKQKEAETRKTTEKGYDDVRENNLAYIDTFFLFYKLFRIAPKMCWAFNRIIYSFWNFAYHIFLTGLSAGNKHAPKINVSFVSHLLCMWLTQVVDFVSIINICRMGSLGQFKCADR